MSTSELPIHGTVYGVLLNAHAEWQSASALMHEAPYKAPPSAPVLYVKTANTWSAHDSTIPVPADVPAVEIGATLGVVLGVPNTTPKVAPISTAGTSAGTGIALSLADQVLAVFTYSTGAAGGAL